MRRLAERGDVLLQGRARLAVLLDESGMARAARQRFEAESAGAGKGVEHHRVEACILLAETPMREDVEHRFARAIAGRPHGAAFRREQHAVAMLTGDDPHALSFSSFGHFCPWSF